MFRRVSIRLTLIIGDLLTVIIALLLASWLRPQLEFGKPLPESSVWLAWPVYSLMLVFWIISFSSQDIYNLQKNLRAFDEIQRLVSAHTLTTLAFAGALYFSYRDISRLQVLSFSFISLLLLISYRVTLRVFLKLFGDRRYGTRRILIIGTGVVGQQVAEMVYQNSWTGLKLVGFVDDSPHATINYPYLGSLEQTVNIVKQERINEVVFALPRQAHHKLANLVAELEHVKINMRVVPDFLDLVFLRSVVEDFGGVPLITIHEPALDPLQRFIKRCFDLVMASIMILPGIPLMILIAIFIKLDSLGPIIFAQQRVGQHGRFFEMYKFRTMYHNSSEVPANLVKKLPSGETTHKFADDPRVTRIGKFLRRTSLDELPQLLNVIKGDMSLVGPRPELPWLVEEYEPWQRKRFEVPQGITGWWQVNGRSTKLMHLHTEEDLYYIKNYSIWLDLQILWRTVKVVISQYGAF